MSATGDRRTALLEAACRMIALRGVRGLRVDQVAREAEASTALIYYHFKNRQGLLAAVVEFVSERAFGYADAPGGRTARDRVIDQLQLEFQDTDAVIENSAVWGELRAASVFDRELREVVREQTGRWVGDLEQAIANGQDEGSFAAAVIAEDTAVRLTALVEGLAPRWLSGLITTARVHELLEAAVANELDA
ncbi:AcrR family transcriptional regulator [Kutzneria viridogrisea]|uniref:AcrR family transcriptional regulator n=1 Tax=Kutzneria viridogrisea TaxID=47990 RepID=A0ABR6BJ93_9PSEU|nr:AcrR family transcriptional regulator [Kutzneria viridogrisea]